MKHSIENNSAYEEIDWGEKWETYFPNKTLTSRYEKYFDKNIALAHLLINNVVYISIYSEEFKKHTNDINIYVNCNDLFAWGCSDGQILPAKEIQSLYDMWYKDPVGGADIWCIIQRKELPQKPILDSVREKGLWDIDELTKEHNLRPNGYDGISNVTAMYKRELYSDWCNKNKMPLLPYDKNWWSGWKEYTIDNPDWYNEDYKKEEDIRINNWLKDNGYDTHP